MNRILAILSALMAIANTASGGEEQERLAYLEDRLDASQQEVRLWQDGWTAIYTAAAIAYAGLALDTGNSDDRTVRTLGAVRAALAASLLTARPHPGRNGAGPVRALQGATLAERLAVAEETLRESARRTDAKRRPARHIRNIVVNTGFGALVWTLADRSDALPFTLLGIAGGEALLLTLPEQPHRDQSEYRRRFGSPHAAGRSWSIVPVPGGVRLQFALER